MKEKALNSMIVFYSHSNNTRKVAFVLKEFLEKQGHVQIFELIPQKSKGIMAQQFKRYLGNGVKLEDTQFDATKFDVICIGTPVWAFGPAPAVTAYAKKCFGLWNKTVILFATHGGAGSKRTLNRIQKILEPKGVKYFRSFTIPQSRALDSGYVMGLIEEIL